MPLFPAYISTWNTKKPGKRIGIAYGDYYLLNTNRVIELRADGDASKFYFANDPDDARDSPDYIECDISVAIITQYADTALLSKFATLDIYPELNTDGTPVETQIEWANIAYVFATAREYEDGICHMVYYRKAWERVEVLVDTNILAVFMSQFMEI